MQLPWGYPEPISLTLHSGERRQLAGPNGIGKSTLLKVIAGQIAPRSGECRVSGRCYYLDQECSLLDPALTAVENLERQHPDIDATTWRTRLGALRLRGDKALLPVSALSGGERLKVALLAITGGPQAPDLLLLDEPDNHLDIESRELLERALADYPGAMLVVSHDTVFTQALGLTPAPVLH